MKRPISRRGFLSATALAGAAALWAGPTRALTLAPMDARGHRLYMNRCSIKGDAYHLALLAEAKASLPASLDAKAAQAALAGLTCPLCGCPVIAGTD